VPGLEDQRFWNAKCLSGTKEKLSNTLFRLRRQAFCTFIALDFQSRSKENTMLEGLRTLVYHVADLDAAKAWYTQMLGFSPYFDQPFYVGFNVGGYELGLVPEEDGPQGPITYWGVPDADAAYVKLLLLGAVAEVPVEDVGGDIRLGAVCDPFGNILGVIYNPYFQAHA
jgi:catechol 2,3-dioxygenase-like lactoylglutathione lyase family enzyme